LACIWRVHDRCNYTAWPYGCFYFCEQIALQIIGDQDEIVRVGQYYEFACPGCCSKPWRYSVRRILLLSPSNFSDGVGECVMKAPRKIIVYIATSADGYIARPNGDVEWLNRRPRTVDYGISAFYPTIDTILWGRKTYDWILAFYRKKGRKGGMFDTKLANYVFSRKPRKRAPPAVKFVSEPVKAFAQRLRATPGKHIWMMG